MCVPCVCDRGALNSELNIERWNYFITLKYVRDPKNLVLAPTQGWRRTGRRNSPATSHLNRAYTTQATKLLDDNLKKAVEDADLSESAVIECCKSMLRYHLVAHSFIYLFIYANTTAVRARIRWEAWWRCG